MIVLSRNEQKEKWRQRRHLQLGHQIGQSLSLFSTLSSIRNSQSTSSSSSSEHVKSEYLMKKPMLDILLSPTRLYDKMERDLQEKRPVFLKQGETSQSLSLSDLFTLKDEKLSPVLKVANPPVRANVLHLSTEYSVPVSNLVQDSNMYHFSMSHASHHIVSVPATEDEVEAEAAAVKAVANELCPLEIILDRVLLTSTGVLLGCWKVKSGDDPITIRTKLRSVLSRAPENQLYDAAILHTSLARLLGPPISPSTEASFNSRNSGSNVAESSRLVLKTISSFSMSWSQD